MDLEKAKDFAIQTWREWKNTEDAGGSPLGTTFTQVLADYLREHEVRWKDGEIREVSFRYYKLVFGKVFPLYCEHKSFKLVRDFTASGLEDYRYWRINISTKHITRSNKKHEGIKDSSIDREITAYRTFFRWLKKRGLSGIEPVVKKKSNFYEDTFDANPPFSRNEWEKTWRYLVDWSKADLKQENHRYWRMCFRRYLQTARWVGNRPSEIIQRLRWSDIDFSEGRVISKGDDRKELLALITIRKMAGTKNRRDRVVPSHAGPYLKEWLAYCKEWREQNGMRPLQPTDLVFGNPRTQKPYPYTQFSKCWSDIREELGLTHLNLYSTRSTFITRLLEEGTDVYLVARLANHSVEVLQKHYDRMSLAKRATEATPRHYGKREETSTAVSALDLM
jgi:integrase